MASNKKLLILPGDGIGPEVMREVLRVIDWMDKRRAVTFGVHSPENNRYHMNSGKRERLLEAGAHFLAPGLEDGAALLDHLRVD